MLLLDRPRFPLRPFLAVLLAAIAFGGASPLIAAALSTPPAVSPANSPPTGPAEFRPALAEAERLAAEKSWTLAAAGFRAALPLAPDATSRFRVELALAEATWRGEARPEDFGVRLTWIDRHGAVLDRLVAQAERQGKGSDAWVAAVRARAELNDARDYLSSPNADYIALVRHYAAQPVSADSARGLVGALQALRAPASQRYAPEFSVLAFRAEFEAGVTHGADTADRAWCAWQIAQSETEVSESSVEQWIRALELANGTRWSAIVAADEFRWRVSRGWHRDGDLGQSVDFPALITEARKLQEALNQSDATVTKTAAEFGQKLESLVESWSKPHLTLSIAEVFTPGTPLRFAYGASGMETLEFSLHELPVESWISRAQNREKRDPAEPRAKLVRRLSVPVGAKALRWSSEVIDLVAQAQPGLYTLVVRGVGASDATVEAVTRDFAVSSYEGHVVATPGVDYTFFLAHRETHAPVARARVAADLAVAHGRGKWTGFTEADGRVVIPESALKPEADGGFNQQGALVIAVEGEPVAIQFASLTPINEAIEADFLCDRPLYRPGETVRWKVVVREFRNARWQVPTAKFSLGFMLGEEELRASAPIALNRFGTAHGELVIPLTARPQAATAELKVLGDQATVVEQLLFQVDRFVPPAASARIQLASGGDSLRPGQRVRIGVQGNYLSGGPLVGATAVLKPHAMAPFDRSTSAAERSAIEQWSATLVASSFRATLGAEGEAEFSLHVPAEVPAGTMFSLTADVLPEGGTPIHAATSWQLSRSGLRFEPAAEEAELVLVAPGGEAWLRGRVRDGAGEPAPLTGVVRVFERRWVSTLLNPAGEVVDGATQPVLQFAFATTPSGVMQDGWKNLHAGWVDQEVETRAVDIGSDGVVDLKLKLPRLGIFRAELAGPLGVVDAAGKNHGLATEPGAERLRVHPHWSGVVLPAPDPSAKSVRGLVLTGGPATEAVVDVYWVGGHTVKRIETRRGEGWLSLADLPAGVSRGWAQLLSGYWWHSGKPASFAFGPRAGAPRLELRPAADELRPGQSSPLRIRALDAAGEPWPAELAIAVSDSAVNSLVVSRERGAFPERGPESMRRTTNGSSNTSSPPRIARLEDHRIGARVLYRGGGSGGAGGTLSTRPKGVIVSEVFAGASVGMSMNTSSGARILSYASNFAEGAFETGEADIVEMDPFVVRGLSPADTMSKQQSDSGSPPRIRTRFFSTAFWAPEVVTDAKGEAVVTVAYPDNLTKWDIAVRGIGADGHSFAKATTVTRTSLPFQARLQLPRFLVAGDSVVLSAALVNRTDSAIAAEAALQLSGAAVTGDDSASRAVAISAQGEARAFWPLRASAPGEATFTLIARGGMESDAMRASVNVVEDGVLQRTASSGRLAGNESSRTLTLALPEPLDVARTRAELRLSASHAAVMIDALPYLIDYPYGCVEQTMSRFLPALVVRRTLGALGLDPAKVEARALVARAATPGRGGAAQSRIGQLDDVIAKCVARLRQAQREDDGDFGWWPEAPARDDWMTAYVAWGLTLARECGVEVPLPMFDAVLASTREIATDVTSAADHRAWAFAVLAWNPPAKREKGNPEADLRLAFAQLFAERDELAPSGRAQLALAAARFGTEEARAILTRNLANGVVRDQRPDSGDLAHWGAGDDFYDPCSGAIEGTALTLLALLQLDPKNELIEPAANWLVLERRSARWSNTRETALAVYALSEYVRQRHSRDAAAEVEIAVNGHALPRLQLGGDRWLDAPGAVEIPREYLVPGANRIEVRRRSGESPAYVVAMGEAWATGETVRPAGHLAEVARVFERRHGVPTLLGPLRFEPRALDRRGVVQAGETVIARVRLKVPDDLSYVMVAVPRPAGCEPASPLSGWDAKLLAVGTTAPESMVDGEASTVASAPTKAGAAFADESDGRPIYREEHDDRSVFFLDRVEAGTWEIVFPLRAVTPGDFRALPVEVEAMYVPEIRANSDARRVRIEPVN